MPNDDNVDDDKYAAIATLLNVDNDGDDKYAAIATLPNVDNVDDDEICSDRYIGSC